MNDPIDGDSLSLDSNEALVADVADEFVERVGRGEDPDPEDYARSYPDIADVLRQVLPALRLMRQSGSGAVRRPAAAMPELNGRLGDYHILCEIGRGGMGVVYEAEQISLKRRVALKVLPFAAALDQKRLQRFQHEAQAAAGLHHSNIVPVHAVGCERGVYYYAMQRIDGQSLAEVIHELRLLNGPIEDGSMTQPDVSGSGGSGKPAADAALSSALTEPAAGQGASASSPGSAVVSRLLISGDAPAVSFRSEAPDSPAATSETQTHAAAVATSHSTHTTGFVRTVAELGIQTAEALEHAHGMDVVHRDIKPGNLIIDVRGNLWVTDFGLARIRDDVAMTMTGDLVGTLGYMSPEQAAGKRGAVDHRTDIYSLGVTLYEMLTLRHPFEGRSRANLIRQIEGEEPVAARRLNKAIPADLETIVLKAMAKEPETRYATARGLADDLRRFLDSRPILARRPTLVERAMKWSRRHTPVVASVVVVLLLAVVALSVSTILIAREQAKSQWAFDQLSIEQDKTQKAYDQIARKQAATKAALNAEAQQRALAEHNFQQARGMLEFFMQVAEDDLADRPELQAIRSKLLQASLEYYQEFIEQSREDPPLRAELAASHLRVARILHEIGSTPAALSALEEALQTQENLVREQPQDAEQRRNLWRMYFQLGVFRGRDQISLAAQVSVQEHLGLSPGQVERITEINDRHRDLYKQFRDWSDPTRLRQRFRDETDLARQAIDEILTQDQSRRLEQISLQRRGTRAFSDPQVAKALGLTADQKLRIREVQQELREALRQLFRHRSRDGFRQQIRNHRDRLHQLLTDEQQQKWHELIGEPFRGEIHHWSRSRGHFKSRRHRKPDNGVE